MVNEFVISVVGDVGMFQVCVVLFEVNLLVEKFICIWNVGDRDVVVKVIDSVGKLVE